MTRVAVRTLALVIGFGLVRGPAGGGAGRALAAPSIAQGWKLHLAGKYDDAAQMARTALEGDITELEWRVLLVRTLMVQGRLEEARRECVDMLERYGHS